MTPLFKKLNLTTQPEICVLDAPDSFEREIKALAGVGVQRTPKRGIGFVIAFAVTQADVDKASRRIASATKGDAIVWMAYPKSTSRKYTCEFNRDSGWSVLGKEGFEPVRMVAIDEDWSALRFRRVEFIKKLTRNPAAALTKAGRARAAAR